MIKLFKKRKQVKEQPEAETYYTILLDSFIDQVINKTVDQDILDMFLWRLKDKQQTYETKLQKDINLLDLKYNTTCLLIRRKKAIEDYNQLKKHAKEVLAFDLDDIGIDESDEKEIWKVLISLIPARPTDTIEILLARAKTLLAHKRLKEKELEGIKRVSEGGTPDREFFDRMIVFVASHHKIQINRKSILLSEFIQYYLLMKSENEILQQENIKHKHHAQ